MGHSALGTSYYSGEKPGADFGFLLLGGGRRAGYDLLQPLAVVDDLLTASGTAMFPHILRRRSRRSRTSIPPVRPLHRDRGPAWRRPLAWAALVTLVASALYFSVTDRDEPTPPAATH